MIYTRFGNDVKILSIVDIDRQRVRCEVTYPDSEVVTRTIAVDCLRAEGGINEIMDRIKELTGGLPAQDKKGD